MLLTSEFSSVGYIRFLDNFVVIDVFASERRKKGIFFCSSNFSGYKSKLIFEFVP